MSGLRWVTASLLGLLCAATNAGAGGSPTPAERIDAVVAAAMKKQKIPGAAVAVVHKGDVVVMKGYGEANVEHGVPVTADTMFQSGSVGKQFTAAAVMRLVEQKTLALDDPLTHFFPDAPFRWSRITVRHLLTHTSGIPGYDYGGALDLRKDYTEDDLMRLTYGLKPAFEPGAKWAYSNAGYVILGVLIRKASGRFYGDLLKADVFAPLGMTSARLISEADIVPRRAAGYRLGGGRLRNQEWVSPSLNTTADGSLYLSVRDMVAWDKGIRAGRVLSADGWKAVFTPVSLRSGRPYPYGFGWSVDSDRGQLHHHHGGAWQGFTTHISRYPAADLSVIVLTNLTGADPGGIAEKVAGLFDPKLIPADSPIPDKDPAVTKRMKELLSRAQAGKLAKADFPEATEEEFARRSKRHHETLRSLGELGSLALHEARDRGDDRHYRHRAVFKSKSLDVFTVVAADGKLLAFYLAEVEPE